MIYLHRNVKYGGSFSSISTGLDFLIESLLGIHRKGLIDCPTARRFQTGKKDLL